MELALELMNNTVVLGGTAIASGDSIDDKNDDPITDRDGDAITEKP